MAYAPTFFALFAATALATLGAPVGLGATPNTIDITSFTTIKPREGYKVVPKGVVYAFFLSEQVGSPRVSDQSPTCLYPHALYSPLGGADISDSTPREPTRMWGQYTDHLGTPLPPVENRSLQNAMFEFFHRDIIDYCKQKESLENIQKSAKGAVFPWVFTGAALLTGAGAGLGLDASLGAIFLAMGIGAAQGAQCAMSALQINKNTSHSIQKNLDELTHPFYNSFWTYASVTCGQNHASLRDIVVEAVHYQSTIDLSPMASPPEGLVKCPNPFLIIESLEAALSKMR